MPTQLASEMALYEAGEQERRENQAKRIADFAASQPSPSNVPSGSKEGSDNHHGEVTNAGDDSRERAEFSTYWKGVKFSRDTVEELLKKEPVSCVECALIRLLNLFTTIRLAIGA